MHVYVEGGRDCPKYSFNLNMYRKGMKVLGQILLSFTLMQPHEVC